MHQSNGARSHRGIATDPSMDETTATSEQPSRSKVHQKGSVDHDVSVCYRARGSVDHDFSVCARARARIGNERQIHGRTQGESSTEATGHPRVLSPAVPEKRRAELSELLRRRVEHPPIAGFLGVRVWTTKISHRPPQEEVYPQRPPSRPMEETHMDTDNAWPTHIRYTIRR